MRFLFVKKKNICLLLAILTMALFTGCDTTNYQDGGYFSERSEEKPRLCFEYVDCEVTRCDYKYWYASGAHFKAEVSVKLEEYGLTKSFTYNGLEAKDFESVKVGDKVTCTLSYWILDSTGEIVRREISSIK